MAWPGSVTVPDTESRWSYWATGVENERGRNDRNTHYLSIEKYDKGCVCDREGDEHVCVWVGVNVYLWVCACACVSVWRPEEGITVSLYHSPPY